MGLPAYSLNEIACRYGADLIVVGSHGQSPLAGGGAGVFHLCGVAPCHVPHAAVNVRVKTDQASGPLPLALRLELLRHILFPTDFSEIGQRALEYVGASGH